MQQSKCNANNAIINFNEKVLLKFLLLKVNNNDNFFHYIQLWSINFKNTLKQIFAVNFLDQGKRYLITYAKKQVSQVSFIFFIFLLIRYAYYSFKGKVRVMVMVRTMVAFQKKIRKFIIHGAIFEFKFLAVPFKFSNLFSRFHINLSYNRWLHHF